LLSEGVLERAVACMPKCVLLKTKLAIDRRLRKITELEYAIETLKEYIREAETLKGHY
jgi:hypothetical protein